MPFEDILRKIEETSLEESTKIIADAEEKARQLLEKARSEASARRDALLLEAKARAEKARTLARARADSTRRQSVLREKQVLVDSVFAAGLSRLAELPADEYKQIVLKALANSARGDETVTFGPEDEERLGAEFVALANKALSQVGKSGRFSVQYASASLGGGLVLNSGGVSQNLTFPALAKRCWDEMEIEIARKLFEQA